LTDSADVVVIGGGIVGAATAYELARRGVAVTLVEAESLAFGATGRNLGYVWVHTRRIGPELDLVMDTVNRLPTLAQELGAEFGLRRNGGLIFALTDAQRRVLAEFVERRVADGLDMRLLDGDEARDLVPLLPPTVVGATFCPLDAQIESTRYVRAFAGAAERCGATILEGTAVRRIVVEGGRVVGVDTDAGRIWSGSVVIAAGGWSPDLARDVGLELPIGSMRLQIVQTEPMPARLDHLVYGPIAIKQYAIFRELPSFREEDFLHPAEQPDGPVLLESLCQQTDGRYLLGIAMDYPGFDWQPDVAGVALITRVLPADLPELRAAHVARAWAGILPFTSDSLPIIDRAPGIDGLVIAAGHVFGNGAGPTTGRLVAALYCEETPVLDLAQFAIDRPTLSALGPTSVW
jgi:glycine/D-amino acid oxidase-like deaminating enzyme